MMTNISQILQMDTNDFSKKILTEMTEKIGTSLCPICQSPARPFYINYDEKLLMCLNSSCDYPFGHDLLKFTKAGEDSGDETGNLRRLSTGYASVAPSMIESDDAKSNKAHDGLEMHSDDTYCISHVVNHGKDLENERTFKNVQDLSIVTKELMSIDNEDETVKEQKSPCLKNEKWIKKLKSLQDISGMQLLKPEELVLLKKEEPEIGLGELKIDIGCNNVSEAPSIRIEIHNTCDNNILIPDDSAMLQIE